MKSDFKTVLRRKKPKKSKVGDPHNYRSNKLKRRAGAKHRRLLRKLGANVHVAGKGVKIAMPDIGPIFSMPKL